MSELLLLVGAVFYAFARYGESVGKIVLAVLGVLLVVIFINAIRRSNKAYANWVDYWADGGPKRRRR